MMKAEEAKHKMDDAASVGSGDGHGHRATSGGRHSRAQLPKQGGQIYRDSYAGAGIGDMKAMMRSSLLNVKTYEGGGGGHNIQAKGATSLGDLEKGAIKFGRTPTASAASPGHMRASKLHLDSRSPKPSSSKKGLDFK